MIQYLDWVASIWLPDQPNKITRLDLLKTLIAPLALGIILALVFICSGVAP